MFKKTNYKGTCLGIIVLFILSAWTPISGKTELSTIEKSISNHTPQLQEHDAVVTCSTYGIGNIDIDILVKKNYSPLALTPKYH